MWFEFKKPNLGLYLVEEMVITPNQKCALNLHLICIQ